MKSQHLTDEALQLFAEGQRQPRKDHSAHVDQCVKCQKEIAAYRKMFLQLDDDDSMILSADFSDRVLSNIGHVAGGRPSADWLSIGITIAVCIGVLVYWGMGNFDWSAWSSLGDAVGSKITYLQQLRSEPFFSLLTAVAILGLIALVERLYFTIHDHLAN